MSRVVISNQRSSPAVLTVQINGAGKHLDAALIRAVGTWVIDDAIIMRFDVRRECARVTWAHETRRTPLFWQGKEVTGFTNGEEEAVGLSKVVPFLVEDEMLKLGANSRISSNRKTPQRTPRTWHSRNSTRAALIGVSRNGGRLE